jgi:chemotaxis response regulator CheB
LRRRNGGGDAFDCLLDLLIDGVRHMLWRLRVNAHTALTPASAELSPAEITPTELPPDPSHEARILIVGIGASAGGLEALTEFFRQMPPDSGMAFVVITHQSADRSSLLPELLGKHTTMPVREVTAGIQVEPNQVYLSPRASISRCSTPSFSPCPWTRRLGAYGFLSITSSAP